MSINKVGIKDIIIISNGIFMGIKGSNVKNKGLALCQTSQAHGNVCFSRFLLLAIAVFYKTCVPALRIGFMKRINGQFPLTALPLCVCVPERAGEPPRE